MQISERKDHKAFLFGVTELIHLARSRRKDEAAALLDDLNGRLLTLAPDFAERQQQVLQKIQAHYRLVATAMTSQQSAAIPVDELVKAVRPGVSLVTCCMNRSENLLKALRSWIECPEISEIIIVDWSSTLSVHDEIVAAGFVDKRIIVARVDGQSRWILSYAFNFGFRIASFDKILKTDADIVISSQFFAENVLRENTFLSGDWRTAEKGQEHINGFFFVHRADLMSIKGFNEYITTYGWDDDDIYFRLEQHGFNRVRISTNGVYHIPHGDAQRVGERDASSTALDELRAYTGTKIMGNRFLAAAMPMWGKERFFLPMEIVRRSAGYFEAWQMGESYHQVPEHIRADVEYYGMATALSWTTELSAYHITKENLYALLAARSAVADITRADVRLASCSQAPVSWYRNVLFLFFDDQVGELAQKAIISQVLDHSHIHRYTVFVEPGVFWLSKMGCAQESVDNLLPIPAMFATHQLHEAEASALRALPKAFSANAAFCVRLSGAEVSKILVPSEIGHVARRDKIYIHVQHGLGNRLRALASATAIARQSDRDLVLIWTPDNHCECRIEDLFEYHGEVLVNEKHLDLSTADCFSYMEIESGSCKDKYIPLVSGRDLYIRSAYVINNELSSWEKENAVLRELKPVAAVQKLIDSVAASGRVGLHVRMEGSAGTDHNSYDHEDNWLPESHKELNLWRGRSHYDSFIARIEKMISEDGSRRFFLAADTPEGYHALAERYPDRLVYLRRTVFDRSIDQLRYALADAVLLSRCQYLLGSTWSSFSELAQRLSTTIVRVEMSGVDF
ncbi:MAG: hypothetical protein CRU78_04580 [Candidatus Accumulibacter phosphatis]|mgnify:CR=1 FL=1|uniref:Glycosyltransferase 2-like domain-containing protein n=1 Tax=Candidatus Accumulibacter phosphatis TaxID=327160 RepID=A0A6A7RQK7_9PROT|nr:hypothetical protein [Candidatus Accumulibacter phosphatis]